MRYNRSVPKDQTDVHGGTFVADLLKWFDGNKRPMPWRENRTPYSVWISEMMLQQTQVKTAIPYFERWMQVFPSVEELARAPVERVLKIWEGLGYYSRARNVHRAAQLIVSEHGGGLPECYESLLSLPGVGSYSAGAICSIAFNQPTPAADGNVARVVARVQKRRERGEALKGSAREVVGRWMTDAVAVDEANGGGKACGSLTEALMELGATICTPRTPLCSTCPVQSHCLAYRTNTVEKFPRLSLRPKTRTRLFNAVILESTAGVLVRQRQTGVVNAEFWELPNLEVVGRDPFEGQTPFCTVRHSITTSRIQLNVHRFPKAEGKLRAVEAFLNGREVWAGADKLKELPFTGAHRKVLTLLENSGWRE
ncbi:MAG TPA: A/G-specific adenine glycosylase [Methylomirabilota bacterium]|nr:A/G-specific adenine glycosylase [Methylomirabilota bacterium]